MSKIKTPADTIDLLLRHNWPDAAWEVATTAVLDRRIDPETRQRFEQRIAATGETPITLGRAEQ